EVRNIARDFLRTELGVTGADFKLIDVDRGEDVVLDDSFADEDGIFEVIAVPGHERAQNVAAQRQLAAGRAGPVGDDLTLLHRVAASGEDFLVDARGRV